MYIYDVWINGVLYRYASFSGDPSPSWVGRYLYTLNGFEIFDWVPSPTRIVPVDNIEIISTVDDIYFVNNTDDTRTIIGNYNLKGKIYVDYSGKHVTLSVIDLVKPAGAAGAGGCAVGTLDFTGSAVIIKDSMFVDPSVNLITAGATFNGMSYDNWRAAGSPTWDEVGGQYTAHLKLRGLEPTTEGGFSRVSENIPSGKLILTPYQPFVCQGEWIVIPFSHIKVTSYNPQVVCKVDNVIPLTEILVRLYAPRYEWQPLNFELNTLKMIYRCTLSSQLYALAGPDLGAGLGLSGDAGDSSGGSGEAVTPTPAPAPVVPDLPDVDLPMSSFQAVMRRDSDSTLSVVIPNSGLHIDDISARAPSAIITISKGYRWPSGKEVLEILIKVYYLNIRTDRGDRNDSLTLSGSASLAAFPVPHTAGTVKVKGVSYVSIGADGYVTIRADLDMFLRLGDTCVYGDADGESFTVWQITYFVKATPAQSYMEVSEG